MTCLSVANAIGLNGVWSEYFLVPDWYFRLHQSTEWHALLFGAKSDSALPIQMWRGFVLPRELSAVLVRIGNLWLKPVYLQALVSCFKSLARQWVAQLCSAWSGLFLAGWEPWGLCFWTARGAEA